MKNRLAMALSGVGLALLMSGAAFAHQMGSHTMMKQTKASKKVESAINKIKKGKMYVCCIKGKCDYCAAHMGACPCGMNAMQGKPVCINCKGGWDAGLGSIPGKTTEDIKVMPMNGMVMGKMDMGK